MTAERDNQWDHPRPGEVGHSGLADPHPSGQKDSEKGSWRHPASGAFRTMTARDHGFTKAKGQSKTNCLAGFDLFDVAVKPLSERDLRVAFPLLESFPHPVLWISDTHEVFWRNKAARETYGPSSGKCHATCHRHSRPCAEFGEPCPMRAATVLGTAVSVAHVHQTGSDAKFFEVTAIPIIGGGIIEMHVPVEDFFAIDTLTGVQTRAFFEQATRRELALMGRVALSYVMVMIDLDRFKDLNDQHGHPAGDLLLQSVGKAITANIRGTDSAGRWGGDEFLVFLPGIDRAGGDMLVRRVQAAIRSIDLKYRGSHLRITASFGMHASSDDYRFNEAIWRADTALYKAKRLGRDRIEG